MANSLHTRQEFLTELVRNGSTIYGYFLHDRQGIFSPLLARRFGAPDTVEDMPYWMVQSGNIASASISAWLKFFADIDAGNSSGGVMVSMKSDDGEFGRYWLRSDVICDENGEPFFALISSDNFTELSQRLHDKEEDVSILLHTAERMYPEVLSINLTQGLYRVIHYDSDAIIDIPETGTLIDLIRIRNSSVYPKDRAGYMAAFSHERLVSAFLKDREDDIRMAYRRPGLDGKLYWMETTVTRREDTQGSDVMLVSMSRNVDAQKAEEIRLREQVHQQDEELRLTMMQVGKAVSSYDVVTGAMTLPSNVAERTAMPIVMENYPEPFIERVSGRLSSEAAETYRNMFVEIRNGSPSGSCDFMMPDKTGRERWLRQEYFTIFDDRKCPIKAVIASSNVTSEYAQALENKRLKENEYLLRMTAQHSDRVVCHYDIKNKTAGILDEHSCERCQLPHLCEVNTQTFLKNSMFPSESIENLQMMFQNIEEGKVGGEIKIQATVDSGDLRWFDIKYSTIYDEQDMPVSAILSHKDITEEYERELAYQQHVQSIETDAQGQLIYIESDLTTDRIERLAGQMLDVDDEVINCSHSDFGRRMRDMNFQFEDEEASYRYFSSRNLLELYAHGEYNLKSEWKVHHEGSLRWMDVDISLMADPYNDHIRAFIRMLDITKEKEAQMKIRHSAERDSMTGIYNRATAEAKTRSLMAEKEPGILVLIDLDDLKGINDTFGHEYGDKAIKGITQVMQSHFRESDVLGRIGGDEFLVYLPGAADKIDSISGSLTSMLRKLSGISVGANGERRIHCSVGCAVQSPDAGTFDVLFKQADKALYHVKRSGKNNFAFYEPEMEQEDYRFRIQKLLSMQNVKKINSAELQHLLGSIASFYQMVLSANLSSNDYYLMEIEKDESLIEIPAFGVLDDFIQGMTHFVHQDDVPGFVKTLSRHTLMSAYECGEKNVRYHFRFKYENEYRWTECIVIFYTNEQGDVCDFTLVRWADERIYEIERLQLQKLMVASASYEYIGLLNLISGEYTLFWNMENTHGVPGKGDFDTITKGIRDQYIEESKREEYYENARFDTIAKRMQESNDAYSYRYTMPDGERQASFQWIEPTHIQVLMAVQHVVEDES